MVGTLLSYIPQFIVILRKKSSYGVSYLMLCAGVASAALVGANAGLKNWPHITCCYTESLSFGDCMSNNLAFLQLFFNLIWYSLLSIMVKQETEREREKQSFVFVFVFNYRAKFTYFFSTK